MIALYLALAAVGPEWLGNWERERHPPPAVSALSPLGDDVLWQVTAHAPYHNELWRTDVSGTRRVGLGEGAGAVEAGGLVYYVQDRRVMRTDGTALGTHELSDYGPAWGGSDGIALAVLDGVVYALVETIPHLDLVRLENDGTTMIRRWTHPEERSVAWSTLGVLQGALHFAVRAGEETVLWRSDGTEGGTITVHNFGGTASVGSMVELSSGAILFLATVSRQGDQVWILDAAGPRALTNFGRVDGVEFGLGLASTGALAYFANETAIYETDGTPEGTRRVMDVDLGPRSRMRPLIAAGRSVFAIGRDQRVHAFGPPGARSFDYLAGPITSAHGALWVATATASAASHDELARIDGASLERTTVIAPSKAQINAIARSPEGVRVVHAAGDRGDLLAVSAFDQRGARAGALGEIEVVAEASSYPRAAGVLGEAVIISATVERQHVFVRVEDGEAEVADFAPRGLQAAIPGRILYEGWMPEGGVELRALETGLERSRLVRAFGGRINRLVANGGVAFFYHFRDFTMQAELWRTDGTSEGTRAIVRPDGGRDGVIAFAGAGPDLLISAWSSTVAQVFRYHIAEDRFHGEPLDMDPPDALVDIGGTIVGLRELGLHRARSLRVLTREPFELMLEEDAYDWAALDDRLVIFTRDRIISVDPPTSAITELAHPYLRGKVLARAGGVVYFAGSDRAHGRELWATDGRSAWLVRDIAAGPASSEPANASMIDGHLVFTADDRVAGRETWRSDGTAEGTWMVFDLWVTSASGAMRETYYFAAGDYVYFGGLTKSGVEPWRFPRSALIAPAAPPLVLAEDDCSCRSTSGRSSPLVLFVLLVAGLTALWSGRRCRS